MKKRLAQARTHEESTGAAIMKRNIDVMLGDGVEVGTLRYDLQGRRESAAFEYGAGWLGAPARFALGPTLSAPGGTTVSSQVKRPVLYFMPRLPTPNPMGGQGGVIMRDHIKRRQECAVKEKKKRSRSTRLIYLLAVDDFSRVGALRFRDEEAGFSARGKKGAGPAPPLIELGICSAVTCFRGE